MIRNLKTLGLLTVAALAMSAMIASAAQAQNGTITAGLTSPLTHTTTAVIGTQIGTGAENYFEANGTKISCPNAQVSYKGTVAGGTATSLLVSAAYGGEPATCGTAANPANELVTITMNGCNFNFDRPATVAGGGGSYTGTTDLVCPGAGPTVAVYLNKAHSLLACSVVIEPANNNNLNHVVYDNVAGSPDKVTVTAAAGGLKYENETATCPGGKVTKSDLKFFSHVTLEAESNGDHVWISD